MAKNKIATKKAKRRRLIVQTISIYALATIVLFILNLVPVRSHVAVDISAWKLTSNLGNQFPSAGIFNGEPLESLVLSNFDSLNLPAGNIDITTPLVSRERLHETHPGTLRVLASPNGRCSISSVRVASFGLHAGEEITIARDREDQGVVLLSLDDPGEDPEGDLVVGDKPTLRCNGAQIETITPQDSAIEFDYKPGDDHVVHFKGKRPLNLAMEWKGHAPEMHESGIDVTKLAFWDFSSPGQSTTTILSGTVSLEDIEKQFTLAPSDSLVLEKLAHFKIIDLALDAQQGVIHLRAIGTAGRILKNGTVETPSALQWFDAQHKWTRWYALVCAVGLVVLNLWRFLRD